MSIYIHIPFCKQACHYCDFHFSTSVKHKKKLIEAIGKELVLRKEELNQPIQNIYFGGGTPSLLSKSELEFILDTIYNHFEVSDYPEITLEANPDDLSEEYLKILSTTKINRLSIGVQSFFEEDLKLMNRAHNSSEALHSIQLAKKYFTNISIDLIYGIPKMSIERWKENLQQAIALEIPHISSYALTVEPNTALDYFIKKKIIPPVDDELAKLHFEILIKELTHLGYEHYEFSNFGKPKFHSQNNMAYWTGKHYIGVGPSAHSYVGNQRKWNISHNIKYIQSIEANKPPLTLENLSKVDQFNELIMTRLRTKLGVDLNEVENQFGLIYRAYLMDQIKQFQEKQLLFIKDETLHITPQAKFLSDGIASELFLLDLSDLKKNRP